MSTQNLRYPELYSDSRSHDSEPKERVITVAKESKCVFCKLEITADTSSISRFSCSHISHLDCLPSDKSQRTCVECHPRPTLPPPETTSSIFTEEEQKEIDEGISFTWDHGTDPEVRQQLEEKYGTQGKEKKKVYPDELIYRELFGKYRRYQKVLTEYVTGEHSGGEEHHVEDEEVGYSWDQEEPDWKDKVKEFLGGVKEKLAEGLGEETIDDFEIKDVKAQLAITHQMRKTLFEDHTGLSSYLTSSKKITYQFIKKHRIFLEKILEAKIGVERLFFTVQVQEWDQVRSIGLCKDTLYTDPDLFNMDEFIVLYEVKFSNLKELGVKLVELSQWTLGRLKKIGLDAQEMIGTHGLTKAEFKQFHPRFVQWKNRMGLNKQHILKLKINPSDIMELGWHIDKFLKEFRFTTEERKKLGFTDEQITHLRSLIATPEKSKKKRSP